MSDKILQQRVKFLGPKQAFKTTIESPTLEVNRQLEQKKPTNPTNPINPTNKYNINNLQVSHSSMGTFHNCERLFEFSKIYGKNAYRDSIPMGSGQALHAGIQEYLHSKNETKAFLEMAYNYPIALYQEQAALPYFKYKGYSLEACYMTLEHFIAENPLHEYQLAKINGKTPAREVYFKINFTDFDSTCGMTYSYVGFMDLILISDEGKILVTDIKTGRKHDVSEDSYEFSQQVIPYALVLEQAFKEKISELNFLYLSVKTDRDKPEVEIFQYIKTAEDIADWARGMQDDLQKIDKNIARAWWPRKIDGYNCHACKFFYPCTVRTVEKVKEILDDAFSTREREEPEITFEINLSLRG